MDGVEQNRQITQQQTLEALESLLVTNGPSTVEDLATALEADAPQLVEALLADPPGTGLVDRVQGVIRGAEEFWQLTDGRLAAVLHHLRRSTFTHRISADEVTRDAIDLSPDLVAPALPRTFELSGTEIRISEPEQDLRAAAEGSLLGPAGWLEAYGLQAGSLIAVRFDGTTASIDPITEDTLDHDAAGAAVEALTHTYEDLRHHRAVAGPAAAMGRAPELHHLLVETIGHHPAAFSAPMAPVAELLARAGLMTREAWVGPVGEPWATPAQAARRRRLESLLEGGDSCCKQAARSALDGWLSWMEAEATSTGAANLTPASLSGADAASLAQDVDHGPVAAMLVEVAVIGRSLLSLRRLGAWAAAITDAVGGTAPNAGVAYLQAVGADASGDGAAAEAHLQAALQQSGDHPACLGFLAELTQDRGDAGRSVELLRRTGRPPSGTDLALLEAFLPSRVVGRNDPCPCESGRKFKVCCARQPKVPLEARAEWLLSKASRFILRTDPGSVRSLQQIFGMTGPGASGEIPATVWDLALFPRGLTRYLDTRGPLLPAEELACARTWPDQPLRLLQVTGSESDGVRSVGGIGGAGGTNGLDLASGDTLRLIGAVLPSTMTVGDTFLGRALPIGDAWLLTEAVLPVPEASRDQALAMLEQDVRAFQILELLVDMQVAALKV